MENPANMSDGYASALLAMSRALSITELEKQRTRHGRPVVRIHGIQPTTEDPDRQEFRIVTVRGEPGDPHYHQTIHGSVAFKVHDDGYNDIVLVTLNITSPLHHK